MAWHRKCWVNYRGPLEAHAGRAFWNKVLGLRDVFCKFRVLGFGLNIELRPEHMAV